MTWTYWLGVVVVIAALSAVSGLSPVGARPVARTGLMVAARIVLIAFVVIVLALFLARRARGGPSQDLLGSVAEIAAGRPAAVVVVARPADL
jgi:hypothetical protein